MEKRTERSLQLELSLEELRIDTSIIYSEIREKCKSKGVTPFISSSESALPVLNFSKDPQVGSPKKKSYRNSPCASPLNEKPGFFRTLRSPQVSPVKTNVEKHKGFSPYSSIGPAHNQSSD